MVLVDMVDIEKRKSVNLLWKDRENLAQRD